MEKNIYRKRFIYIISLFLIIIIIAWVGPISLTLELRSQKNEMMQEVTKLSSAPARIADTKIQLRRLDNAVGFNDSVGYDQRDLFVHLATLTSMYSASIREMPERHTYKQSNMQIETHVVKLEGNYISLLKIINEIESNVRSYSIASVRFYKIKDDKSGKQRLNVELFIQRIQKI